MTNSGGGVRRFFGTLMGFLTMLRTVVVNIVFLVLLLVLLIVLFGGDGVAPVPDGAALVLAPTGQLVEDIVSPDFLERLVDPSTPPS